MLFTGFAIIPRFKLSCQLLKHSSLLAQEGIDFPCSTHGHHYWQLAARNACLAADPRCPVRSRFAICRIRGPNPLSQC